MWILAGLLVAVAALYIVATRYNPIPRAPMNDVRLSPIVDAATLHRSARVILVTLDGARWQDVLDDDGAFARTEQRPVMRQALAASRANGVVLVGSTSSSVPLSLPGYQALAAGAATPCEDNLCPRITVETLTESLARRMSLAPEQVATFGSWARLVRATASRDGRVRVDVPPEGAGQGLPWPNARWDKDTVELALSHWRSARPRFLHVALLDMDERAHANDAPGVVAALESADTAVATLLEEVARLPEEERRLTTVLITTDHGRGWGPLWSDHGPFASSKTIFLIAIGDLVRGGNGAFTQADLRPTIERLFGWCTEAKPIDAVVDGNALGCE